MAESSGSSVSSSSSNPVVLNTPQSDWGLQLSHLLSALGQSQYQWAQDQYNKGAAITDANIAQFMEQSGKGAGLAQTLIQQYQNQFAPLIQQYLNQANTYNSEERQRFMMGRAESQAAQAATAARNETERKLQGMGVNVSSGRYQDVVAALRMQDAAARAGAGTQAALDTADRGRAMTEKGIQFGQNVPGMAVNALNSAYQGVTGAENAILGQQNTGANLMQSAVPFYNAASGANKLPSVGQQSSGGSSSHQESSSPDRERAGSGSGSGRGAGGPLDTRTSTVDPQMGGGGSGGGGGGRGGEGGASMRGPFGGGMGSSIQSVPPYGGGDEQVPEPEDQGPELGQWGGNEEPYYPYGDQEDFNSPDYGAQNQDYSGNPDMGSYDDFGGQDVGNSDMGGGYYPYSDQEDYGSSPDYGSDEGYARGGGVLPTSGGQVPRGASPSRGQQTDDIPARLNAGEYVIPRDVVAHQGTKFFNDLIDKSRRLRTGMGGPKPGAQMKPALRMKPSFVSRPGGVV